MTIIRKDGSGYFSIIALAMALAFIAGIAYLLIDLDILSVSNLKPNEEIANTVYAAAGSYLLGGLLILMRRRWLWMIGAVTNGLVILFFFLTHWNRPDVLLSSGGVVTSAQVWLELVLIYLVATDQDGLSLPGHRSWLWKAGAVMNGLAIVLFFLIYRNRSDVFLSPSGITIGVQVWLELTLIYLIMSHQRDTGINS